MAADYELTVLPFDQYPIESMRDPVLAGPGFGSLQDAASVYRLVAEQLDEAVLGVRAALEILREGREGEAAFAAQQHIISVVSTGEAGAAQARLAVQALNEQASYFARVHLDMNHLGTPSDGAGGFPVASDEVREAAVEASRRYEGNANFNYANMFQPFVPPPESGLDRTAGPTPPAVDWGGSGGTAGIGAAAAGGFAPAGAADAPGALGGTAGAAGAGGTNSAGAAGAGGGAGQIVPGAVPRAPGPGGIGPATAGPPGAGAGGPGPDGTGVPGGGAPGSGAGGAAAPKGPAPGWVPAPRPGRQPVPGSRTGYGTGTGAGTGYGSGARRPGGGGWSPGWTPTGTGSPGSGTGRLGTDLGRSSGSSGEFGRPGGSSAEARPGLGRGPVPGEPMSPGRTGGSQGGVHGGMPFLGGGAGAGGQGGEHRRPAWLVEDDPDSIWLSGLPPHGPAVIGEENP